MITLSAQICISLKLFVIFLLLFLKSDFFFIFDVDKKFFWFNMLLVTVDVLVCLNICSETFRIVDWFPFQHNYSLSEMRFIRFNIFWFVFFCCFSLFANKLYSTITTNSNRIINTINYGHCWYFEQAKSMCIIFEAVRARPPSKIG